MLPDFSTIRRRSWQMNRKQQEQNLVGIPPAAREKS
jgi:hypothetical protein